jgi:hypothetical protein
VFKPFSIAPDIYYGVSDQLTLGLIHSAASVGVVGAGSGICLAGEEKGCAKVYDNIGLDGIFSLSKGTVDLAAHAGVLVNSFDPMLLSVKLGVLGRFNAGKLAVVFDPWIGIGVTERDAGNKELINVPVNIQFQATPQLAAWVGSGIFGPLDGFGDAYFVPLNIGALFGVSSKIDAGAAFGFLNIGGKNSSADFRALNVFANIRL